jgi:hypothetical protein
MKLAALALAVAARAALRAAHGSPVASVPGLVYTPGYGNSMLVRFDPLTLERTGR